MNKELKIAYVSDLHLGFYAQYVPSVVEIGDIIVYNNAWGYPMEIKEPKLRTMIIVKE